MPGLPSIRIPLVLVLVAIFALAGPAVADPAPLPASASPWAETEHGKVRLIAAVDGVGTGETVPLGLEFVMAPGWKIYWRSPGDAGFPPQVDWSGSTNLAAVDLRWPVPMRFSVLGFETIGYEDHVILPIAARLARAGEPVALTARVEYLTCKDICIPYSASLALDLGAGAARPNAFAAALGDFAARVPGEATGGGSGLRIEDVRLNDGRPPQLVVRARSAQPFVAPDLFVEGLPEAAFSAPSVEQRAGGKEATLRIAVHGAGAAAIAGTPLTFTLVDGDRAIEQRAVAGEIGAEAITAVDRPLAVIVVFALLGGLILNLMPCVLPVLSMKLLAVVGHGGGDRRRVRAGFLASAAGIAFSFLVLATALIGLQAAGTAAGWGLQFQRPWFLIVMTLVMSLFACNLWGWFDIPLPGWLGRMGGGVPRQPDRASPHAHSGGGLAGHFLAGALATLLATPCSAPFLGTAIGFALAAGPAEILVVFAAVALGLALPYLAVALFPVLATRLPRPGPWMVWLRRILGFALLATAVWLLFVLAAQTGPVAALAVAAIALAIIAVLAWTRGRHSGVSRLAPAAVGVLALAALLLPHQEVPAPAVAEGWRPLDAPGIAELVAAGRVVYVNVTADWCLTCKVNEHVVLSRDPVRGRLADADVVPMRGDWTRPDEGIARFLAGFGRYGIPFDAVYGPGLPAGEALPELLTTDAVLDALDRAAGGRVADAGSGVR